MTNGMKAAAVFAVAAMVPMAQAQYTGVSHPDAVPATTSPETVAPPAAYQPTPPSVAAQVQMKQRAADGMVVGVAPGDQRDMMMGSPAGAGAPISGRNAAGATLTERDDSTAMRAEDRAYVGEAARPDVDAQVVMRVDAAPNELPIGTFLHTRIQEQLSTTGTTIGQAFHAELTEAVVRDGRVLLPAGALLTGRVTDVHGGRRITGAASIHLEPLTVTMPDGVKYRIAGQVVDTNIYDSTKVDSEGTIVRKDHAGKTLAVVGLATGAAAATGGMIAGAPGALIGAGIGAGVGTVVWLKQDRQTAIPAGTRIVFALNRELMVGVE